MRPWRFRSFAKLNLHLQVVGRRSDGYHELRTVFQTVDLHDVVELDLQPDGIELEVKGAELPTDERNLAYQAAALALQRWRAGKGCRIRLDKRLPVASGLGGGSSNAATVLLGLRELLAPAVADGDLWSLAAELGADVPFFLLGGTALGVGRGDEVIPLPDLPPTELWIVVPPLEISTAELYSALGDLTPAPLVSSIMEAAQGTTPVTLSTLVGRNDLEPTVMKRFPGMAAAHRILGDAGADVVRLSGTGAALFASFPDARGPEQARRALEPGTWVVRTRTLSRNELAARRRVTESDGDPHHGDYRSQDLSRR